MICEKILGNIKDTDIGGRSVNKVHIDWFERGKRLLKKTAENGEEIGIKVTSPLNDGDILYEDPKHITAVELDPCELIEITVRSTEEMGRLCFEIGNRHISPAIGPRNVRIPYDEPTMDYLLKLGFKATRVYDKFSGYIECRGHSHDSHGHHHEHRHE